jgi:deazaflavin-dependent oxidoreductase (nitroreductase family)
MSKKAPLAEVANYSNAQLTTRGRKTGKRHTVTTWFLVDGAKVFLVTMNMQRDWPRNVKKNGYVELAVGGHTFRGTAKQITDAKRMNYVKKLLRTKYWAAWIGSWLGLGPDGAFEVTIASG